MLVRTELIHTVVMSIAVPFPTAQPPGYEWLEAEPEFEADRHLALEFPEVRIDLTELGYAGTDIADKATPFAVSSPFRILSDEGALVMLDTCRRLREFHRPAGERIERTVRGGCYRSRWLRDLCTSPALTAHMDSIYGVSVAPHAMPLHLGHLNFEPEQVAAPVDKWHHDTLPLDFVMMVTDPASLSGGRFQWFNGTKDEAAALAAEGRRPPDERVVTPDFPGPGYAIALHGDMVVHRAAALSEPGERITMVNGYVATDTGRDDQSRSADLIVVDDPAVLYAEWAKFAAWRSAGRLQTVIDDLEFSADVDQVAAELESAISDTQRAIAEMRSGAPDRIHHYERR